jgi:hypothetical protein
MHCRSRNNGTVPVRVAHSAVIFAPTLLIALLRLTVAGWHAVAPQTSKRSAICELNQEEYLDPLNSRIAEWVKLGGHFYRHS